MKSILISMQTKRCEFLLNNEMTVEVKKTNPKLETPFKCYIYCTKKYYKKGDGYFQEKYCGKVIGEFVCDAIISHCEMANADIAEQQGCIKRENLLEYSNGKELFGWHISDLKIYDRPKELSEFKKAGFMSYNDWLYALYPNTHCGYEAWARKFNITHPPQSWCYVEEGI